ncbi:MAG: TldD/PmbA family protein, partial [Clostridia bacterium]|nr:TldD/PmbA family protein [Clostridia bacterium]
GAGVRIISGGRTSYAYTNDVTFQSLSKIANSLSKAVETGEGSVINLQYREPEYQFEIIRPPDEIPVEKKVRLLEKANKAARGYDSRIKQTTVGYGDAEQEITVANSEGLHIQGRRIRCRMVVNVVSHGEGLIQTGSESASAFSGFELFSSQIDVGELAETAASRSVLMLEARPAPAGTMVVVMSGEAGGTMVHEACGHGLEADLVQKKLSVYAGKKGEKVASNMVTVIDDATIPNRYGSYPFDDEGTTGEKTVLIEKGILKNYMYDWLTAHRDGTKSTGNGRRESYQYVPIPRMTNTYIAPGEYDPKEIISSVPKGLFVKKMGGGQVNTTNGDFVFEVTEGYLIENGKITAPVRGATLTGNGPKVLQLIDMVGNDQGWAIGTCGKEGQGVPVGDAQPTIRIPEMVVGGVLD